MKVLITGATGTIGSQILLDLIACSDIDSIVAISRRDLAVADDKLQVIVMQDFTTWTKDVLDHIADADAMIWAIGSFVGDEAVDIHYPLAFQLAFFEAMPKERMAKFRYIHLSGAFCETDDQRPLWFLEHARKVRGKAQVMSEKFAVQHQDVWECLVIRPGAVFLEKDSCLKQMAATMMGMDMAIKAEVLGAFVAHLVVAGGQYNKQVFGNRQMVEEGRALLKAERRGGATEISA